MKKKDLLTVLLLAALCCIVLLIAGCYEFDFVIQPSSAEKNSSFEVRVSITTDYDGNGNYYIPYFGIRLPVGWTVQDSIEFSYFAGLGTGVLTYSDSLAQEMNLLDPPKTGYYWWVAEGQENVPYTPNDTFLFNPVITTDSSTGTFFLDYMAGDNYDGWGSGLNRIRSDRHYIGVDLIAHAVVTSFNDQGPGSLREALRMVDFDGTITFNVDAADTIKLNSELEVYKNIQLLGDEEHRICISGQGQTRIFNVFDSCSTEIADLDLINGYEGRGGGIFCDNAELTLKNISISDCAAALKGGGLFCDFAEINLENVSISNCSAYEDGGGIHGEFSGLNFENLNISGCTADKGGGLFIRYSGTSATYVTISGCTAAIGGGIYLDNTSLFLGNALLIENTATSHGGAMFCQDDDPHFLNVTVAGNMATHGSGLYCFRGQSNLNFIVQNSIIYGNAPPNISLGTQSFMAPPSLYFFHSNLEGGPGGIDGIGNISWNNSNIDTDPVFDSSGDNPYQLSPDSPCIDAGSPDTTGMHLPFWDLTGNYRLWDGDMDGDTVVDMGAYEFGSVGVKIPEFKIQNSKFKIIVFPNPFSEIVHLEFEIRNPSLVSIHIFNAVGEMVAVLQDGYLPKGKHRLDWNAAGLPSGLYFCKVIAGKESANLKLIRQ
jgi:hypothetical protein